MDSVFLPSNLSSNKRQILLTISGGVFSIHLQLLFILFEIFEVWTDLFVQFSFTSHFFQNLLQTFWHIGNMNYHLRLSFEIWSKFLFYFQCLFILFGKFKMWTALIDHSSYYLKCELYIPKSCSHPLACEWMVSWR